MITKAFKTPSDSEVIKTEVVCPNDSNPMGILMGGRMVEWMDIAAAVCAQTHAGRICVTACIQEVHFHAAAKVGDIVTITSRMTRAFKTSMEVYVHAYPRNVRNTKNQLVCNVYFTFVAMDPRGKAVMVPELKPISQTEKEHHTEALHRKEHLQKQSSHKKARPPEA